MLNIDSIIGKTYKNLTVIDKAESVMVSNKKSKKLIESIILIVVRI